MPRRRVIEPTFQRLAICERLDLRILRIREGLTVNGDRQDARIGRNRTKQRVRLVPATHNLRRSKADHTADTESRQQHGGRIEDRRGRTRDRRGEG